MQTGNNPFTLLPSVHGLAQLYWMKQTVTARPTFPTHSVWTKKPKKHKLRKMETTKNEVGKRLLSPAGTDITAGPTFRRRDRNTGLGASNLTVTADISTLVVEASESRSTAETGPEDTMLTATNGIHHGQEADNIRPDASRLLWQRGNLLGECRKVSSCRQQTRQWSMCHYQIF